MTRLRCMRHRFQGSHRRSARRALTARCERWPLCGDVIATRHRQDKRFDAACGDCEGNSVGNGSHCRAHLEAILDRAVFVEDLHHVDATAAGAHPAAINHLLDMLPTTLKHGLHATVTAISYPPCDTTRSRRPFDECSKADTLHAPFDPEPDTNSISAVLGHRSSHYGLPRGSCTVAGTATSTSLLRRRLATQCHGT